MKTNLDHWLLRNFVFRYCVLCNTVPDRLPNAIKIADSDHSRWSYRLSCEDEADFHRVTARLASSCFAFQSKIEVRDTFIARALSRWVKDSIVLRLAWIFIGAIVTGGASMLAVKAQVSFELVNRIRRFFGILQGTA